MRRWPADLTAARASLWRRLDEPHVAPIVTFADKLAVGRGLLPGAVPYPDPDGGGIHACVLFLLNDPGDGATDSRMLTVLNDDPTSRKQRGAIDHTGFDRSAALHWNGIPWPVAKSERQRNVAAGATALLDLLPLLDDLRGVLALGEFGRKVWEAANRRSARYSGLAYRASDHPCYSPCATKLDPAYAWAAEVATGG